MTYFERGYMDAMDGYTLWDVTRPNIDADWDDYLTGWEKGRTIYLSKV
ncbi:hypothetical protein [Bradyrhizobium sp.]